MKKSVCFLILLFFGITTINAKTVTSIAAQTVAANFFKQNSAVTVNSVTLAYTESASSGEALYYVFDINDHDGFVIVVADDAAYPVVGYSTEGKFVVPASSSNAEYWMKGRREEIVALKSQNIQASSEISTEWNSYLHNKAVPPKVTGNVGPLLQTLWDQPNPYNAQCPGGSVTGCVATTMAQIMRYWKYPAKGTGSSSYNSSYGTLSANYGNTTYNWNNMPVGRVTSSNNDVATIMYHCGVSVQMSYSPNGSGAYVTKYENPSVCAQVSFSKYFGYDEGTIKGLLRKYYTDASWINLIETDLNANRPVEYAGYDPSYGGHTWVCDGYDANNYMHMNWGWSGYDNGYFSVNSLNPGGSYNFGSGQEMLIGIEPKSAAANDAGIFSIKAPVGTSCNSTITPIVQLQNFGTSTLTSCTITYHLDASANQTYTWSGSLASSSSVNITLPVMSVSSGVHSFSATTSNPNAVSDGNSANDQSTGGFTIIGTPVTLPLSQGFEGTTYLPSGWATTNSNGDATWQVVTTVAHTGTNCIGMNNCNGDGSTNMSATKDKFTTVPYNFSNVTNASLTFDVAYAQALYQGTYYNDALVIYYSTNCGATWTQCYTKSGSTLATAPAFNVATSSGCWAPTSSQWRTDVVSLSSLNGKPSVMFAFENQSGWGEWLYLDNINISGVMTGIASVASSTEFEVYPNPTSSAFTIEGRSDVGKIHYSLYNVIGEEVKAASIQSSGLHFSERVEVGNLPKGIYFLRVSDNNQSWVKKVIVQ